MKVAYLVNQYPLVSHTFVRREIVALEAEGVEIARFSIRRSPIGFVDPADGEEAARTTVLLDAGALGLVAAMLKVAFRAPGRFFTGLALTLRIGRRSDRGLLRNFVYFAEACLMQRESARREIDHLHAHFGTNSAAVAMLCRALGGPSYSFTVHGPEEFDKATLLSLREKIARARFVVGITSYCRSQIFRHCAHGEWRKIHVVPCGVDDSFLEPAPPIPAAPRLVSVGRLSEQKGQLLLVAALGRLRRAGKDATLTLVGDGELRGELEAAIAREGLEDRVRITGWATEEEVRAHLAEARALVLPSFAEGLPVVIMEALAMGRPVVSTYVAGIPELVEPGKNGWLVPAGSVEALAAALQEVLDSSPEKLARFGEEGRTQVRNRHHTRLIARTLRKLFDGGATEREEIPRPSLKAVD